LPNLWLAQLTDDFNACNAPDLPTDITGTNIWVPKAANLNISGPVFANIVLADEINTPAPNPRFWVMEEQQVTVDVSVVFPAPFFCHCHPEPHQYQALFPPEAQMDRFILCLSLGYPTEIEELKCNGLLMV